MLPHGALVPRQINEFATEAVHIVLMHGQICAHCKHQSIFFYLKRRALYVSKEMLFIASDHNEIISAGGGGNVSPSLFKIRLFSSQLYNFSLSY